MVISICGLVLLRSKMNLDLDVSSTKLTEIHHIYFSTLRTQNDPRFLYHSKGRKLYSSLKACYCTTIFFLLFCTFKKKLTRVRGDMGPRPSHSSPGQTSRWLSSRSSIPLARSWLSSMIVKSDQIYEIRKLCWKKMPIFF